MKKTMYRIHWKVEGTGESGEDEKLYQKEMANELCKQFARFANWVRPDISVHLWIEPEEVNTKGVTDEN